MSFSVGLKASAIGTLLTVQILMSVLSVNSLRPDLLKFKAWQEKHGISYSDPRIEAERFEIWSANLEFITAHNRDSLLSGQSMRLGINKFGDMTNEEYKAKMLGSRFRTKPGVSIAAQDKILDQVTLPDSWNWVDQGIVAPIKDQGNCGSCWAFSAVAAIEGAYNRAYQSKGFPAECKSTCGPNKTTCCSFSEQQVADCTDGGADTCNKGGEPHDGILNIVNHKGMIDTDSQYPYVSGKSGKLSQCQIPSAGVDTGVTGYMNVSSGDEFGLLSAVYQNSIISVGIDASSMTFQFYESGVYNDKKCKNSYNKLDHGVAVVGYGTGKPVPPVPPPPPPGPKSCIGKIKYQCQHSKGCHWCDWYCDPDSCNNTMVQAGSMVTAGNKTEDYWIVRNSWGSDWGMSGYIFMSRNKNNQCGIATDAVWAVL